MALNRISSRTAWQLLLKVRSSPVTGPVILGDDTTPLLTTLADGGWALHVEPDDQQVEDLFDCFMPLCHPQSRSKVFAQVGQSLDGRIATVTGASHYINGEGGLDHLHRLRAMADVVVVGAGTVRADNPRLTVRRVDGRQPDRVVIDPRRGITNAYTLFGDQAIPTYRLVADAPRAGNELQVADGHAQFTPESIVRTLHDHGYQRIFIEGGSQTVSSFLEAGLLDHLHLIVAPMIIGSGVPALQLTDIDTLDQAHRPNTHVYNLTTDYLFDMRFARP
ncbi:RibD family protein [Marinobacter fonticola]|uniref:RibD family protein n=1 Tax=Marinobacter fonticola TaxID=2603215 RepID=UPI0011E6E65F|nr:RibD family protein [Marinobacter fonticola]